MRKRRRSRKTASKAQSLDALVRSQKADVFQSHGLLEYWHRYPNEETRGRYGGLVSNAEKRRFTLDGKQSKQAIAQAEAEKTDRALLISSDHRGVI